MNKTKREVGLRAWIAELKDQREHVIDYIADINPIARPGSMDLEVYLNIEHKLYIQIGQLEGLL